MPDFLGRGWSFPIAPGPDAEIAMVSDEEDVRQSIRLILDTEPGERVMRPDFGAGLRDLVFEPINVRLVSLVQHRVEQALTQWEPRIRLHEVSVTADEAASGRLLVKVDYVVRATNSFYNLVYPFYLKERS
jgi:phage baseplate assembly protein W